MLVEIAFFVANALSVLAYRGGPVDTSQICGPTDTISSGDYTLMNNIWNSKMLAVGTQCCVSGIIRWSRNLLLTLTF